MATVKVFAEWFCSKASAERAASRLAAKGYTTKISHALDADGRRDWHVEAFTGN